MPEDVLQDADGVVHQQHNPQGETAKGHDVDGKTLEIHQGEGGNDGNRHGSGDDEGAAHIAEKEEKDHDGHHTPPQGRPSNVVDGVSDIAGVIPQCGHGNVGKISVDVANLLLDPLHHLHRVGQGLPYKRDDHGAPAVDLHHVVDLFIRVLDVRQLFQMHGDTATTGNHGLTDLIEAGKLPECADHDLQMCPVQVASGEGDVLRPQGTNHVGRRKFERPHLVEMEVNVNLSLQTPSNVGGGHSTATFKTILDLIFHEPA